MLSSAWESSGQKLKSGLCVEQCDSVNKKNKKMMSVVTNESRDKTFVNGTKEFENDCMLAALESEKGAENDCTLVAALMSNEHFLGLENDCMMLAALNPVNESELKLEHGGGSASAK